MLNTSANFCLFFGIYYDQKWWSYIYRISYGFPAKNSKPPTGRIHVRHPKTRNLENHGIRQRARVPPTSSPTNLPITHQTLSILSNQNTLCLLLRNIQHTHSPSQSLLILSVYVCIYTYFTERESEREKKGSREIWNCSFTNTHADTLRNNPRIIQISEREDRMRERDTHTRHWYQDFPLYALIRTLSSTLSHHTKTKETASVCVCAIYKTNTL